VWDKDLRNMHVCGENIHDTIAFEDDGKAFYYNLQNGEGSGEHGAYELMQYTGLQDRDGKDIYEGDILKRDWQEASLDDDIGHVSFQDGGFVLHLPGTNGFDEYLSQYYRGYSASSGTDFYIIGNIYETPELLTTSQGGNKHE
jgi:hypothetical protein